MIVIDAAAFGERVRGLRQARKLTQANLAERAGITDETVSRVERGAFEPTLSTAVLLAQALETRLDTLTGRDREEEPLPHPLAPNVQRLVDLVLALDPDAQAALLRMAELLYQKRRPGAKERAAEAKRRREKKT